MQINSAGKDSTGMLVDENGRALTQALTKPFLTEASKNGDAFYIATDFVALTTTGAFTGLLYLKNDSTRVLQIARIRTCGTVVQEWKLIKNPTAGTLITAGGVVVPRNIQFSSGLQFGQADVLAGSDAQTVTDGDHTAQWINGVGHSVEDFDGAIQLGKGNSIALSIKPAVAGDVCVSMLVFYGDNGDS